jgi:hypothetical protein
MKVRFSNVIPQICVADPDLPGPRSSLKTLFGGATVRILFVFQNGMVNKKSYKNTHLLVPVAVHGRDSETRWCIFAVSQSTFLLVLQKITACQSINV